MKKMILFMALLMALSVLSARQAKAQGKKNQIKTSLVMPLASVFELSYERMLNTEMSLQLGVGIGSMNYVNPQFRYFLSENLEAPSGAFISPYFLIGDEISGGGLTVGYQRLFKQKISLEAYLGPLIAGNVTVWGGINVGLAF
ncbi:MAG TPA: hypothetical protein VE870_06485 [Bacteroidales bacterium]|nr:hypothetical protein [Bacteroidales bacterium]